MRTIGCAILGVLLVSCGGTGAGGGTVEPAAGGGDAGATVEAAAEPEAVAASIDDCGELAGLMCRTQGLEGDDCTALEQRVRDRGGDYCTSRLPDAREQVGISERLLAEEGPAGEDVAERSSCAEAEREIEPATPDPEHGEFTLEEALAGLSGEGNPRARIVTRLGTLDCVLFADEAPLTVANFVGLARGLRPWWDPCRKEWRRGPYYDGLVFHRVIPGFMIQGGDVLGSGEGDPGYEIPDEFHPAARHDRPGTMSMANAGPNTGGSQFFVTEGPTSWLDDKHSVFGRCEHAGIVARAAREPRGDDDRPTTPLVMRVEIYR